MNPFSTENGWMKVDRVDRAMCRTATVRPTCARPRLVCVSGANASSGAGQAMPLSRRPFGAAERQRRAPLLALEVLEVLDAPAVLPGFRRLDVGGFFAAVRELARRAEEAVARRAAVRGLVERIVRSAGSMPSIISTLWSFLLRRFVFFVRGICPPLSWDARECTRQAKPGQARREDAPNATATRRRGTFSS